MDTRDKIGNFTGYVNRQIPKILRIRSNNYISMKIHLLRWIFYLFYQPLHGYYTHRDSNLTLSMKVNILRTFSALPIMATTRFRGI